MCIIRSWENCVILDEVDILCKDEEFEAAFQSLINSSPVATQYLFVTATLPVDIYNKIVEILPHCEVIMGPGIHRTSAHLEEFLIDCSGEEDREKTPDTAFLNKKSALIQLVEESPATKTIVFCNKGIMRNRLYWSGSCYSLRLPTRSKRVCSLSWKNSERCWRERQSVCLCSWEASSPGKKDNGEKPERPSPA